jgi:hypothetical protein
MWLHYRYYLAEIGRKTRQTRHKLFVTAVFNIWRAFSIGAAGYSMQGNERRLMTEDG